MRNILKTSGCPFSHGDSSCHGHTPKRVEWDYENDAESGEALVFFDFDCRGGFGRNEEIKKFLWLCESRDITKPAHIEVFQNRDEFFECYDAIFTCDESLIEMDDRFIKVPNGSNKHWVEDHGIHDKNKLISMFCSGKANCNGHLIRNNVAVHYRDKVDLYGRGINPVDRKEEGLNDYMFSIAMENSVYDTYYTEKLLDCFATGTVPIYWGCQSIGNHFNPDGIIMLNDEFDIDNINEDLYHSMKDAIEENYEKCMDIEMADDLVHDKIMEIMS